MDGVLDIKNEGGLVGMMVKDIKLEINGCVWKVEVDVGIMFDEDDLIFILESMKMEILVFVFVDGCVVEVLVGEGDEVKEG